MKLREILLSAGVAGGLALPAQGAVIAPDQAVNGLSQADLTARWYQWMVSYPAETNPVLDTTGANAGLGSDQSSVSHPDVFFLAGNFSGSETRAVTIGGDQALFLPFINTVSMIPLFGSNEAEVRADAAATLGTVTGLFAKIDGADVALPVSAPDLSGYRQQSAVFPLTFPAGGLYSGFGITGTFDSVTDGYWLALEPLSPGQHTLEFGASASGTPDIGYQAFALVQTYEITVTAVPEPGTWIMLLSGGVALSFAGRRRLR